MFSKHAVHIFIDEAKKCETLGTILDPSNLTLLVTGLKRFYEEIDFCKDFFYKQYETVYEQHNMHANMHEECLKYAWKFSKYATENNNKPNNFI